MQPGLEDKDLLKAFKEGNNKEGSFQKIIVKYQEKIYWHIRRMVPNHDDADDVIQEVFIKVWDNLKNFREDASLYTWIYRIVTNECLTFLRKKKRYMVFDIEDVKHELNDHNNGVLDGEAIQNKLQNAIMSLPEKQRVVFNMKYYDEMKYNDMSKILRTSVGALKASYHLAVKKIEKFINEN